ncbi:MAG: ABC transporter ATP-binding protein/permease [Pseudomonadales bacterium]|nr:ABC transporter ATP-binding protein/permease [Pseudomonadales bacterium]
MHLKNTLILWRSFTSFFKFAPRLQLLIFVLMLMQGLTAGIGLLLIIPLLDVVGFETGSAASSSLAGIAGQTLSALGVDNLEGVLICYIAIVCFLASLRYKLSVMGVSIQQAYIGFLRDRLYRSLLHSRWQYIIQNKMSDFTHSLSGQVQTIGHSSHLMLSFLSQSVLTLVMVSLAMLLSWEITLLAVLFAAALLVLLLPLNRIIYGSGQHQLMSYKQIFQMLTEQLGSLKMIKSYASESYYADQMQTASSMLEAQQTQLARTSAKTQWVYMVAAGVGFSLFFYTAQMFFAIPLATIFLLLVIFARLLPQIAGLQKTYQQLLHKVPAFKDVSDMLEQCESERESSGELSAPPSFERAIKLHGVAYRYPNKSAFVFQNLFLEIKKNETVALVGHSGAGKSTLADIIAGLFEATSGHVYCDNVEIDQSNILAWRKSIAYVTQEVYLFHDTIRANLTWVTKKQLTDDELWQALRLAAADEFIALLPDGLDTIIGDRGIRLSGGERQRLAIARAIIAKPQLLILDEATSALDHQNEQKIQKALAQLQGKLTIIIIAHRTTTISHVDKVIDIGKRPTLQQA